MYLILSDEPTEWITNTAHVWLTDSIEENAFTALPSNFNSLGNLFLLYCATSDSTPTFSIPLPSPRGASCPPLGSLSKDYSPLPFETPPNPFVPLLTRKHSTELQKTTKFSVWMTRFQGWISYNACKLLLVFAALSVVVWSVHDMEQHRIVSFTSSSLHYVRNFSPFQQILITQSNLGTTSSQLLFIDGAGIRVCIS